MRRARVRGFQLDRAKAERYLPSNYRVIFTGEDENGPYVLIEGEDDAGWTMEDYIIPRFASGLYFAEEVPIEFETWRIGEPHFPASGVDIKVHLTADQLTTRCGEVCARWMKSVRRRPLPLRPCETCYAKEKAGP